MADRRAESPDGLSGQCPAAPVAYRHRHYCRESSVLVESAGHLPVSGSLGLFGNLLESIYCGLGVQGVKACLYLDNISASVNQSAYLFHVCIGHLLETVRPVGRALNVRGQSQGLGCRTDASGHVNLAALRSVVSSQAGYSRTFPCHDVCKTGSSIF